MGIGLVRGFVPGYPITCRGGHARRLQVSAEWLLARSHGVMEVTAKKPPLSGSGYEYSGYPPGTVPGMHKRGITPHSGCFFDRWL